jgi:DNA-binding MarR family transcriptional regulator
MKKQNVAALQEVITETIALFHMLRATGDAIHQELGVTSSMRGVLNSLAIHGPRTVPQLARMRPVSRQHIQKIVNALLSGGLVEYRENPDHKRSKLVQLTGRGSDVVEAMTEREHRILDGLDNQLDVLHLREAAQTLRSLRGLLSRPEFNHKVQGAP